MSARDTLRSFAESRESDGALIRDGITYGQARELLRIPADTYLNSPFRSFGGSYINGRAYVVVKEQGREVAEGFGETLIEAFSDAMNDLMRRMA